jgi:hypothetical protein
MRDWWSGIHSRLVNLGAFRETFRVECFKFGETPTKDNTEPSLIRKDFEGVETRRSKPKAKAMVKV